MKMIYFFFFKQKTAYEMRISDWSSDVCSSDLSRSLGVSGTGTGAGAGTRAGAGAGGTGAVVRPRKKPPPPTTRIAASPPAMASRLVLTLGSRSEENTSELQSLMSISYAGFYLKKNKRITQHEQQKITGKKTT